jgi:hypothetical protein
MEGPSEMEADGEKVLLRLLVGPVCLAVMILILAGEVDHLYLFGWL